MNWFPNGSSLSSVLFGNVGVSAYGIKPDNAPSETISGGFGYGTLFAVCGRGDEGYGYGYAIYSGSNATGSRVFATYDRDSGWSERVSKSDLFANNYQTNPDLVATPFAAINGFNSAVTNIPDDAKNTWNSLQTIWLFPNEIGNLTKNRLQIIITGNNTTHRRMFENNKFSNWS